METSELIADDNEHAKWFWVLDFGQEVRREAE